ncbi:hypothetical protein [Streptomyces sp. DHE17-7]|uniref:hypothetical protein n=1 Tax=Streptomyces sp. DHE17-7 TaxID=2759949 RepID=UPI002FCE384C
MRGRRRAALRSLRRRRDRRVPGGRPRPGALPGDEHPPPGGHGHGAVSGRTPAPPTAGRRGSPGDDPRPRGRGSRPPVPPSTARWAARACHASRPDGIRLDTGCTDGDDIGVHYDPMLAKAVAHAPTRAEAVRRLAGALERAAVHGPVTNRDLLVRSLRHEEFASARMDTGFYDRHLADLTAPARTPSHRWPPRRRPRPLPVRAAVHVRPERRSRVTMAAGARGAYRQTRPANRRRVRSFHATPWCLEATAFTPPLRGRPLRRPGPRGRHPPHRLPRSDHRQPPRASFAPFGPAPSATSRGLTRGRGEAAAPAWLED